MPRHTPACTKTRSRAPRAASVAGNAEPSRLLCLPGIPSLVSGQLECILIRIPCGRNDWAMGGVQVRLSAVQACLHG